MKQVLVFLLVLGLAAGSVFATESRIEAMGKTDRYLLDENAMFTNPAYFMLYPNILTGQLGKYNEEEWPYTLSQQWFGGWLTVSNVVVGAAFNRHDALEDYLDARRSLRYKEVFDPLKIVVYDTSWSKDTITIDSLVADTNTTRKYIIGTRVYVVDTVKSIIVNAQIPRTVGETDLFLGYNLGNIGIGAHAFVALQDSLVKDVRKAASIIVKGDLGLVLKLNDKDLVDVALTLARVTYFNELALADITDLDEARYSFGANARAYLTVGAIGGQVVPSFKFSQINIANDTTFMVSPGIGYQREIEGGMFCGGLDYTYEKERDSDSGVVDTTISHKIVFSFGIEKQIAWPWFTLRVGGRKVISPAVEIRPGDGSDVIVSKNTNPDNDRSSDDLIGAGVALKAGDRLRFDITANERLPFSNFFNGSLESIASKISATYAF